MNAAPMPRVPTPDRGLRLVRMGYLQEAEDEHDRARLDAFAGVTRPSLEAEKTRWCAIGEAIAALARLICETCAASAFCEARPRAMDVAIRVSEAIDDQLDGPAWRVADAAARLAACKP
jgi:hypothetical protein